MSFDATNVVALPKRLPRYGDEHIAAGKHEAAFLGYETWARRRWDPRVVMLWQIMTMGSFGVVIPGYYRALSITGRPRRNGRFRVGTRSRLYRDLARMMDRRPAVDFIPVDDLVTNTYNIVVRDVTTGQDKHDLGVGVYSVIEWVEGRV